MCIRDSIIHVHDIINPFLHGWICASIRRELEEQAEEYEEMYEKRFKLLQQSVKKVTSRKRRRQDDGEGYRLMVIPRLDYFIMMGCVFCR